MWSYRLLFIIFLMPRNRCFGGLTRIETDESILKAGAGDVEIRPATVAITKGQEFSMYLHSTAGSLDTGCNWILPPFKQDTCSLYIEHDGVSDWKTLEGGCDPFEEESRPKEYWKYQLYQVDSDKDCGLRIANASRYDNGIWRGSYKSSNDEIFVYVKAPPESIEFKNPDSFEPDQDWTSGSVTFNLTDTDDSVDNVTAMCETLNTRPKATVTWMIGNEIFQVNDAMLNQTFEEVDEGGTADQMTYTVVDYLTFVPKASHDGKQLRCVYTHEAYNNHDTEEERQARVNITVYSKPDSEEFEQFGDEGAKVGEELLLEVKFHSRPPPDLEFVRWNPYDVSTPITELNINTTVGRYTVYKIVEVADPIYSAKLKILELQKDDEGKEFILTVRNELGQSNLTVILDGFDGGLETAAIAGIVVGVIVLIVIVAGIIAFFVMKKKRKSKSTIPKTTSGVSTIPNVGRVNPTPVTDSENYPQPEFETVDLQNSPTNSTRHVTHTIEFQMQEQPPHITHNNENSFQVENLSQNEEDSTTKF